MSVLASVKLANTKTSKNLAMETVVLNSIIYSKPSSCTMAIDISDDTTRFRKHEIPRFDFVETMDIDDDVESLPKISCDKKKKKVHFDTKPTIHILHTWNYAYRKARESNWRTYTPSSICIDSDNEEDIDLRMPKNNNDIFSLECLMENLPKLSCDKKKKKVHFDSKPTVHTLHTWNYAYRKARQSDWRIMSYLHKLFNERIEITAEFVNPVLNRYHRQKIYEERFSNFNDKDEVDIFQQPAKRRKIS